MTLLKLSARSKKAPAIVVVLAVAMPLLLTHLLAAATLAADDGGGSGLPPQPEGTIYSSCFRAGGCMLTPEWCPIRCQYLGFTPGAGCQVMDDGHIYCCCGPIVVGQPISQKM
uniref:Uncharacterized protein n=1 Tax=Leersia perrieri TaxID=77586 RepID=A0A0D9XPV1_9ORYZ